MAKRTATFHLALPLRDSGITAYQWLSSALRAQILAGGLRPGARLPATRDLAWQYGLSRGTIIAAFEPLKAEGYLEGSIGSGTYESAAAAAAAIRGVDVVPLSRYGQSRKRRAGLQLGFAAVDAHEIQRGVQQLAAALEGERRNTGRRRG